ncbi:beta-lactamase family protein [Psychrosphaera sp. F3M07]|uniref:serine hydrolase domain-containing protein n=1 Tax=Psychrosphaera sp. F3M07 TaxID=2841560 RepID=UPI001C0987AB|nr:serine hydrolase [Psychrosphaera sp. F3M07]MBU2916614.1 beta-lactamase family protein [Psychrosphaera sp. F3M07]
MKKILYTFVVFIGLLFALAPSILGFSLLNLGHAINVSTALGAKLGCSSYFVSGFSKEQTVKDLASYSPVANIVTMDYQEDNKRVTASLYGMAETSATYREGLGCALDAEGAEKLDLVTVKKVVVSDSDEWPLGSLVSHKAPVIQDKVDEIVRADNEKGYNTRALLVIKDGHLLAETYGPNVNKDTPLLGWSMGKSLTAIMIGHLQHSKRIESNPTHLFEQWQDDQRANLTLVQLLQMSSGLEFDETYAPGSDATHMLFTAPSASDVAITSPLTKTPGSEFSYSSGTTNLLSRYVHEKLGNTSQQSYDYLIQQLFEPLGMANSVFEVDDSGIFVGSSYIYASGRDWARLGLLMLNQGEINGHRLLTKDWVAAASMPNTSENDKRYGYQFWLNAGEDELRWPALPSDAYAMMGNRKQTVMIIPSQGVVFVRLGWTAGDYPMEKNYRQLLDVIN